MPGLNDKDQAVLSKCVGGCLPVLPLMPLVSSKYGHVFCFHQARLFQLLFNKGAWSVPLI